MPDRQSLDLLQTVERLGMSGSWIWHFESHEQIWSPGMYRILGLPHGTRADYGLLLSLAHPEDRFAIPSSNELQQVGTPSELDFRILRPDGTLRTVSNRVEVSHSSDGRPLRAVGTLIDVSDHAMLARAHVLDKRRRRALFEQVRMFTSTTSIYPFKDFSNEWLELVGLPKQDLLDEPTRPVMKEERLFWRDHGRECYLSGKVVHTRPRLVLADGSVSHYRMVMVPMLDQSGNVESWTNYVGPINLQMPASPALRDALERRVMGNHLRAARALLGWSMTDLAKASGLSLSTMRRLEDANGIIGERSLKSIMTTLRNHGISFALADDSTIMLGKR